MPLQQHPYNGLARSVSYSIYVREWTRPPADEPCWRINGLALTDSVLGYGTCPVHVNRADV